jgi:membrane-associated protease RseP (regulator of RpoE activity)
MFATSLNLLPGGQLDGGHIVYAVAPWAHRRLGSITVVALFTMGTIGVLRQTEVLSSNWDAWPGWILWGVILLLMGRRHPPVNSWPGLDRQRQFLAVAALLLLIFTFMPAPLYQL